METILEKYEKQGYNLALVQKKQKEGAFFCLIKKPQPEGPRRVSFKEIAEEEIEKILKEEEKRGPFSQNFLHLEEFTVTVFERFKPPQLRVLTIPPQQPSISAEA